ncbi:MAG: MFS transporter [Chloroflexi bacterium]|nr:MFS transporter [Chloroflexota bacterium]MBV9597808.1 MFS transporter [Chloroflexota bacterium]
MADRSETGAVYAAACVQGVALVTFPAASTIFTSPSYYGLSSTAYGGMFLPQAVTAIASSLFGTSLSRSLGIKRVFLLGLLANLLSMCLLLLSQMAMSNTPVAYAILLMATASLGIGFGLTVPSLNTFVAAFFPRGVDRAVLMLNALLGLGTVLAPVFVAIFVGLGYWAGLPLVVAVSLVVLVLFSSRLPLQAVLSGASTARQGGIPHRFWVFAAFALLYGMVETMNGNWASLYMVNDLGATTTLAALALTAFWGMVTVGRVLFALIERSFPEQRTFHLLPFVAALAMALIAALPGGSPALGIVAFGLAGLGCSALLPLTIGFGQQELVAIAASAAGFLIAFYQMGYGIAAFGVGPLERFTGLDLQQIYGLVAIVALGMGVLSFVVAPRRAAEPAAQAAELGGQRS